MAAEIRRSTNPFKPTFGSVPFALAGRGEYIDDVMGGLANQPGDPNRSTIFIGPRGSGKTVLLKTIAAEASAQGWVCVNVSAHEGMLEKLMLRARQETRHLVAQPHKSNVTSVQIGPLAFGRRLDQDEQPWWWELQSLVRELNAQDIGFLVTIDEVDPSCDELIQFISTYQDMVVDDCDVALMMAGLPSRVSALLLDEHVSFVRRAFQRRLNPIESYFVEEALSETLEANGRHIELDALSLAAKATQGFAYAIQLVGFYLWMANRSRESITMEEAQWAVKRAHEELYHAVVEPTLSEVGARELDFLKAMAQYDGPVPTSEIAKDMGVSVTNASNLRRRLADRGIVASPRFGEVDFIMPVMREYLRG